MSQRRRDINLNLYQHFLYSLGNLNIDTITTFIDIFSIIVENKVN